MLFSPNHDQFRRIQRDYFRRKHVAVFIGIHLNQLYYLSPLLYSCLIHGSMFTNDKLLNVHQSKLSD